jgi:DNA-binding MarR family transcriptional regulator
MSRRPNSTSSVAGARSRTVSDRGPAQPSDPAQPVSAQRISAWAALLRVHAALVPVLERELGAAHRLPLSWYDALLELNAAPQRRLRMSELGSRVVLSRERVSRVVDELARAGLVVRERNPDDKRSVYAVITPAGRDRLRAAAPDYLDGIQRHFTGHLSDAEAQTITTALNRVLAAAEQQGPASVGAVAPRSPSGADLRSGAK